MSGPDPIRVALVGCGAVAQLYYAPALAALQRRRVVAVRALCDPDAASRQLLQRHFPAAAHHSADDLSPALADLAIIASPPRYHGQQSVALLRAGLGVLCEKPMATSVAEAEAMVAAAAETGGLLAVGLFRRFLPAAQTIRQVLSTGLLGEVRSFAFSEGGPFRWPVQSPSYFHKETARGGVLIDIGAHTLDLLTWWLGTPDEVAYQDDAMGGIEANCRLWCRFANGTTGEVRLSRDCELPNHYLITGSKGWLRWQIDEPDKIQLGFEGAPLALDGQIHTVAMAGPEPSLGRPADSFEGSFVAQIANVAAAMGGREALRVPGAQALDSLRLIAACYQQRTLLPMPWLSAGEQARASELHEAVQLW